MKKKDNELFYESFDIKEEKAANEGIHKISQKERNTVHSRSKKALPPVL
jgi:hypothetical protein